ncbi:MAG: hypothetical protein DRQ58_02780 [Gammaproteobacteria bacterium]|nr:MAG: hypothetical protein DRQ58_02780 [Gammaproteobacteria bacterium]
METTQEFKCDRCNSLSNEERTVISPYIILLFTFGFVYWPPEKRLCKDCAGFINLMSILLLLFILIGGFIITVIMFVL